MIHCFIFWGNATEMQLKMTDVKATVKCVFMLRPGLTCWHVGQTQMFSRLGKPIILICYTQTSEQHILYSYVIIAWWPVCPTRIRFIRATLRKHVVSKCFQNDWITERIPMANDTGYIFSFQWTGDIVNKTVLMERHYTHFKVVEFSGFPLLLCR